MLVDSCFAHAGSSGDRVYARAFYAAVGEQFNSCFQDLVMRSFASRPLQLIFFAVRFLIQISIREKRYVPRARNADAATHRTAASRTGPKNDKRMSEPRIPSMP